MYGLGAIGRCPYWPPGAGDGWLPGAGAYLFEGAAFDVEGGGWYGEEPRGTGGAEGVGRVEPMDPEGWGGAYARPADDDGRPWLSCIPAIGGLVIFGGASPAFGGGGNGVVLRCPACGGPVGGGGEPICC